MDRLDFHPLSLETWDDFELLFGPRGACGGCWCMFWKLTRKEFEYGKGEINRQWQRETVEAGIKPGLLAYIDGTPVGWIAVEPRSRYPGLSRSRILAPVDDQPVWSVPCFFVASKYRLQGLTVSLLKAAVEFVRSQGGSIVEGYPVDTRGGKAPPVFVYTGTMSAFLQVGFVEIARRSQTRPIMRLLIS